MLLFHFGPGCWLHEKLGLIISVYFIFHIFLFVNVAPPHSVLEIGHCYQFTIVTYSY